MSQVLPGGVVGLAQELRACGRRWALLAGGVGTGMTGLVMWCHVWSFTLAHALEAAW